MGPAPAVVLTLPDDPAAMFEAFEAAPTMSCRTPRSRRARGPDRARLDRRAVAPDLLRDPSLVRSPRRASRSSCDASRTRARLLKRPTCLAYLTLHELPEIKARLGRRAYDTVLADVVAPVRAGCANARRGRLPDGHLGAPPPRHGSTGGAGAPEPTRRSCARAGVPVDRSAVRLTPAIGVVALEPESIRARSSRGR